MKEPPAVAGGQATAVHSGTASSSRAAAHPARRTPKDENVAAPSLDKEGQAAAPGLRSGWFEAVEDSEAQASRKIPTTQGLWELHPPRLGGEPVVRRSRLKRVLLLIALVVCSVVCSSAAVQKTENIVLITLDGARTQEIFGGLDLEILKSVVK